MALWVAISISLACICLGFGLAVFAFGDARSDLEQELRIAEIENARLRREN